MRRSDWFVALVMLVCGLAPMCLLFVWAQSVWTEILACVLFWPCAAVGGLLVKERA